MRRYQYVTARRILIQSQGVSDMQARKRADDIVAAARKGEDFGSLAAKFSQDPQDAKKGGLMPAQHAPMYDGNLEDLLYNTKPGTVGGPLKVAAAGYIIVKIENVETKFPADFEKVRKQDREESEKMKFERLANEIQMKRGRTPRSRSRTGGGGFPGIFTGFAASEGHGG